MTERMSKRVNNSGVPLALFFIPPVTKKKKKEEKNIHQVPLHLRFAYFWWRPLDLSPTLFLRLMMCVSVVSNTQAILNFIEETNGQHIYISPFLLDGIIISNRILHFSRIYVYVLLTLGPMKPLPFPIRRPFYSQGVLREGGMGRGGASEGGRGVRGRDGEGRGEEGKEHMRWRGRGFGGTNKILGEINERCYTGVSGKVWGRVGGLGVGGEG